MFDNYVLENQLDKNASNFPDKITDIIYDLLYRVYITEPTEASKKCSKD